MCLKGGGGAYSLESSSSTIVALTVHNKYGAIGLSVSVEREGEVGRKGSIEGR